MSITVQHLDTWVYLYLMSSGSSFFRILIGFFFVFLDELHKENICGKLESHLLPLISRPNLIILYLSLISDSSYPSASAGIGGVTDPHSWLSDQGFLCIGLLCLFMCHQSCSGDFHGSFKSQTYAFLPHYTTVILAPPNDQSSWHVPWWWRLYRADDLRSSQSLGGSCHVQLGGTVVWKSRPLNLQSTGMDFLGLVGLRS